MISNWPGFSCIWPSNLVVVPRYLLFQLVIIIFPFLAILSILLDLSVYIFRVYSFQFQMKNKNLEHVEKVRLSFSRLLNNIHNIVMDNFLPYS